MSATEIPYLADGTYRVNWAFCRTMKVNGTEGTFHGTNGQNYPASIEFGNFGEADEDIVEKAGAKHFNIQFNLKIGDLVRTFIGIVRSDGKQIILKYTTGTSVLNLMTDEEVAELESDGDPIEAPPGPYKIQPEKRGKLLWISGAPGLGKSTTAQHLAKTEDYVYYEADCFTACKNPYLPLDSNTMKPQKPLVGEGLEKRQDVLKRTSKFWQDLMTGEPFEETNREEFFTALCENIRKERERIGGDWAVACVALNHEWRDWIRSCLPDVIFVVLSMKKENTRKRLEQRHDKQSDVDMLMNYYAKCEAATDTEEKAVNIVINEEMTKEDVVKEILERTKLMW